MTEQNYVLPNGGSFRTRRVQSQGRRCIFISDVHGEAALLRRLLDRVGFGQEDLLFLLGDLCEKGTDSLETLRLVMELTKGGNVHTLQGNCDVWNKELDPALPTPWLPGYLQHRSKTLVADMCREQGLPLNAQTDMDAMKVLLWAHYQPELQFLNSLPRIIEVDDRALLVHASIDREDPPYTDNAHNLVKRDLWAERAPAFHKWVLCGHMPVINYARGIPDCSPWVDREKHIISIDGGNVINASGQLNAFVAQGETYSCTSVDKLPARRATQEQQASEDPVYLGWYNGEIEILQREDRSVVCRHLASGRVLRIPADMLYMDHGKQKAGTFTDYRLPVQTGDRLKVCRSYEGWSLCKKDGVLGWVPQALLEPEEA